MDIGRIHIGTSGWHYEGWVGSFYPADAKARDMLAHYVQRFAAVEINNSFYRIPKRDQCERWAEATPDDFCFAVKAPRIVTHVHKLNDKSHDPRAAFDGAVRGFGHKLGPILYQLPPGWAVNLERLEAFLERLPDDFRYTFEFRHRSWLNDAVYDLLRARGAALCFYDYGGFQSPIFRTADFVYARMHGPEKAYQGAYSDQEIGEWAERARAWSDEGCDVFIFFDNDQKAQAPMDAARLCAALTALNPAKA